jgi:hypothetical protein
MRGRMACACDGPALGSDSRAGWRCLEDGWALGSRSDGGMRPHGVPGGRPTWLVVTVFSYQLVLSTTSSKWWVLAQNI